VQVQTIRAAALWVPWLATVVSLCRAITGSDHPLFALATPDLPARVDRRAQRQDSGSKLPHSKGIQQVVVDAQVGHTLSSPGSCREGNATVPVMGVHWRCRIIAGLSRRHLRLRQIQLRSDRRATHRGL
jgi:hypothetical protein